MQRRVVGEEDRGRAQGPPAAEGRALPAATGARRELPGGHPIPHWPSVTERHCSKNIKYIKIHEVIVIIL